MSKPLSGVVKRLKDERRYIQPPIRNLNTGEVYTSFKDERIEKSTPRRPVNPRRVDLGELICKPCLQFISQTVTPNQITFTNSIFVWLLLFCAIATGHTETSERPLLKMSLFILCGTLNFITMMLDCLDGMHARASGQCSRFGEFLDHWMDSLSTPIFAATVALAYDMDGWVFWACQIPAVVVYNSQLVHFHYSRVFIHTTGVETQIFVTFVFFMTAFGLPYYRKQILAVQPDFDHYGHVLFSCLSLLGAAQAMYPYYTRYTETEMFLNHFKSIGIQAVLAVYYTYGVLDRYAYSLLCIVYGWRINGSYVLCSLSHKPYSGFDFSLLYWAGLIGYFAYFTKPMNLEDILWSELVPYVGSWPLTSHNVLPYLASAEIAYRSIKQALRMRIILKN